MSNQTTVWMLGHSVHAIDRFLDLLRVADIQCVVDVRSTPQSRWPQFQAKALRDALVKAKFGYVHEPVWGGKPPSDDETLVRTIEARRQWFADNRAAIMCSEGSHLECHRHYLLAPVFIRLGFSVMQIATDGRVFEDSGPTPETLRKAAKYLPPGQRQTMAAASRPGSLF